jgi:hypothetical protein
MRQLIRSVTLPERNSVITPDFSQLHDLSFRATPGISMPFGTQAPAMRFEDAEALPD